MRPLFFLWVGVWDRITFHVTTIHIVPHTSHETYP